MAIAFCRKGSLTFVAGRFLAARASGLLQMVRYATAATDSELPSATM
jgi:hypothetical protein